MPSFDVVSEVDTQEIDNAVNQARKELATRFDFKGSNATIEWTKDNHFRTKQYYRVYRWDGAKTAVVKDWFSYDVK